MTVLVLCLTLLPMTVQAEEQTPYLAWNETSRCVEAAPAPCTDYTLITRENTPTTWESGWYVVSTYNDNDGVTISDRVTVSGDVHLILKNGCKLTINGGINVSDGNSLTIYAQSTGENMGKLTATASAGAGIGSDYGNKSGTITINGGNITATGTYKTTGSGGGSANAIGGGAGQAAADMTKFSNCFIRDGAAKSGTFYSDFTFDANDTIEEDWHVELYSGAKVTVPEGVTLTNNGTFTHNGTLLIKGEIVNNGTVNHVYSQNISVGDEGHQPTCSCGETNTLAPHEYEIVVGDDSFQKVCRPCGEAQTVYTISNVIQTPAIYEDGQTVKLSVSANAVDSNEGSDLSYQWLIDHDKDGTYEPIEDVTGAEYALPSYQGGDRYRVEVTLDGQTLTRDYTLPSPVEITGVTAANGTYDGQAHAGYTGTPAAEGYSGEFTVSYQKKQADGSYADLPGAPTAVGDYRVKFSFVGDGICGTKTLEFSVGKADATLTLSADSGSVAYNGTTTFTVTESSSGGVLSVSSSDETVAAAVLNGNTITVSGKKVGTATITVTSAATNNYNEATVRYEVTVSQDSNAWLTQPAITGWTAGDTANAPTYEAKYGNDTVVVEYKKADAADDTYTTTVPAAAGTYKVRVSVAATTDYAGLTAVLDLTIQTRYFGSDFGGSGSSTTSTTQKNPDGSTTTTTTNQITGTVTETTKRPDDSTTVVETKKDGTVTTTNKTANGSTGTVVTDKNGNITEVTASVSDKAIKDAEKNNETVTLTVKVPVSNDTKDAPAVEVTLPKNSGSVKVEIPVENVTPGTVVVIMKADGTEEVVRTSVPTANGVELTMVSSATVKVVDKSRDFIDVPATHTFNTVIDFASARGIVEGYGNNTFNPAGLTTGAAGVTVVARIMGENFCGSGSTVMAQDWAKTNGIAEGLDLSGNVTRRAFMVMLWRAAGCPEASDDALAFSDVVTLNAVERAAFAWAVEDGIIGGYADGTVRPYAGITRGAMAAIAERYMTR